MPTQKPTLKLATQYIQQVVGKTPTQQETLMLLDKWTTNSASFKKALQWIKDTTPPTAQQEEAQEKKPSIPLVKKYMSTVMGEANPSSAEVAAILQQWQNTPVAFNKAMQSMLQSIQSMQNTKALGPKEIPAEQGVVPSVDFVKEYLKVVSGDAKPTAARIKTLVDMWANNQAGYQEAQVHLAKVKAGLTKKPAPVDKGPTLPNQLNAIAKQTEPGATENESFNDIEVAGLLATVKQELKKKFNPKDQPWGSNHSKYKKAYSQVVSKTRSVQNKTGFLTAVIKTLNPTFKPGAGKVSAKPGEFHSMTMPSDPLSPFAQTMAMSPEKKEKATALKAKIAEYEALLKKLKDEQKKASTALSKTQSEKEKLGGINEKLLKYFSFIEKNCSQYLAAVKEANGRLLFRGQDDAAQPIFVAYPRLDREPKDSDPEAQKLIDKYLSALGFKALRSNSLFTTSSENNASNYGTVYAIFPKNGFEYTWSTKHDDLVIHSVHDIGGDEEDTDDVYYNYEDWQRQFSDYAEELDRAIEDDPSMFNIADEDIEDEDVFYKNLKKYITAITKMPEYKVFKAAYNKYYDLDTYNNSAAEFHQKFAIMAEAFIKFMNVSKFKLLSAAELKQLNKKIEHAKKSSAEPKGNEIKAKAQSAIKSFGFVKENLPAALKARHEVMVVGEYIAVNYEQFSNEIEQYFIKPSKTTKVSKPTAKKK